VYFAGQYYRKQPETGNHFMESSSFSFRMLRACLNLYGKIFYRLFLSEPRQIIHVLFAFIGAHELTLFGFAGIAGSLSEKFNDGAAKKRHKKMIR